MANQWSALLGFQTMAQGMSRHEYIRIGFAFAFIKYAVECSLFTWLSGKFYSPLVFVSPFMTSREPFVASNPQWLTIAWMLWTLPFLWLAVTCSIRRAIDAKLSPWLGLTMLIPLVNLFMIAFFSAIPSKAKIANPTEESLEIEEKESDFDVMAFSPPKQLEPLVAVEGPGEYPGILSALFGLFVGATYLVLLSLVTIYVVQSYGAALFFGTPTITCVASSFMFKSRTNAGFWMTVLHSCVTLTVACVAFLFSGLEGAICIVMVIPIFLPLGIMGAAIGYAIASIDRKTGVSSQRGMYGCMLILPFIGWIEHRLDSSPILEVRSQVLIEAPPEVVWENVIRFSDIEEPPTGILATGVAYPLRAVIHGEGVGAVRHCEFSTGAFVEPITIWDAPKRLAFDVTSQPEPMSELSPYRDIHPPHLEGSFRSIRGEFRLTKIREGETLLEGSTWYQIDMGPRDYWRVWTDSIIHQIHMRVLNHIKKEVENAG